MNKFWLKKCEKGVTNVSKGKTRKILETHEIFT